VLSPISIPADQIKFRDVVKGWAAPKDIKLTAEENARLMVQVNNKMKAKLIDENIIAVANENAKTVVAELLSATVQAVDPEFTVVVVQ
jgi:restriction endonuclease Mrr